MIVIGIIILVVIAAAIVLIGRNKNNDTLPTASTNTTQSTSTPSSTTNTTKAVAAESVTIENLAFSPSAITVKVGTTVTWTNKDSMRHNVASDDGSMPDGPLLGQNETYKFTFTKAGTYPYHCSVHPSMHGSVVVTN